MPIPSVGITECMGLPMDNKMESSTSIWQTKPWWCQPWTIVLTGVSAVTGSWLLLQRLWMTVPLAVAVLLWWTLFLWWVPQAYRRQIEQ